MTRRRDLKRRVRDRLAQTGESYMTALRHVRALRDPLPTEPPPAGPEPISVVELIDITELGATLGMKCPIRLVPALAERIDVAATLRQLVAVLAATEHDPALSAMRSVVLRGEPPVATSHTIQDGLRFVARVRAGIGGISEGGHMLAFSVSGRSGSELIVFVLWPSLQPRSASPPSLIVAAPSLFDPRSPSWDMLPLGAIRVLR
jgi:hypothetical protein